MRIVQINMAVIYYFPTTEMEKKIASKTAMLLWMDTFIREVKFASAVGSKNLHDHSREQNLSTGDICLPFCSTILILGM